MNIYQSAPIANKYEKGGPSVPPLIFPRSTPSSLPVHGPYGHGRVRVVVGVTNRRLSTADPSSLSQSHSHSHSHSHSLPHSHSHSLPHTEREWGRGLGGVGGGVYERARTTPSHREKDKDNAKARNGNDRNTLNSAPTSTSTADSANSKHNNQNKNNLYSDNDNNDRLPHHFFNDHPMHDTTNHTLTLNKHNNDNNNNNSNNNNDDDDDSSGDESDHVYDNKKKSEKLNIYAQKLEEHRNVQKSALHIDSGDYHHRASLPRTVVLKGVTDLLLKNTSAAKEEKQQDQEQRVQKVNRKRPKQGVTAEIDSYFGHLRVSGSSSLPCLSSSAVLSLLRSYLSANRISTFLKTAGFQSTGTADYATFREFLKRRMQCSMVDSEFSSLMFRLDPDHRGAVSYDAFYQLPEDSVVLPHSKSVCARKERMQKSEEEGAEDVNNTLTSTTTKLNNNVDSLTERESTSTSTSTSTVNMNTNTNTSTSASASVHAHMNKAMPTMMMTVYANREKQLQKGEGERETSENGAHGNQEKRKFDDVRPSALRKHGVTMSHLYTRTRNVFVGRPPEAEAGAGAGAGSEEGAGEGEDRGRDGQLTEFWRQRTDTYVPGLKSAFEEETRGENAKIKSKNTSSTPSPSSSSSLSSAPPPPVLSCLSSRDAYIHSMQYEDKCRSRRRWTSIAARRQPHGQGEGDGSGERRPLMGEERVLQAYYEEDLKREERKLGTIRAKIQRNITYIDALANRNSVHALPSQHV